MSDLDEKTPYGFTWRQAISAIQEQAEERRKRGERHGKWAPCPRCNRVYPASVLRMTEHRGLMCPVCADDHKAQLQEARSRVRGRPIERRAHEERDQHREYWLTGQPTPDSEPTTPPIMRYLDRLEMRDVRQVLAAHVSKREACTGVRESPSYNPACVSAGGCRHQAHDPACIRQVIYDRDGNACLWCGATERLTLDHMHPTSKGGTDLYENLQTLCHGCNGRKGASEQPLSPHVSVQGGPEHECSALCQPPGAQHAVMVQRLAEAYVVRWLARTVEAEPPRPLSVECFPGVVLGRRRPTPAEWEAIAEAKRKLGA